jgi:uncharacterized repeat protein (TIGR01451 family)
MLPSTRHQISNISFVALLVLSLAASNLGPSAASASPTGVQQAPGPVIVVRASTTDAAPHRVAPRSGFSTQAVKSATITVHYIGTWDTTARNAFQYAVDIWESQINSSVEIVVDANWSAMGTDVLGAAGATTVHRDFGGAPSAFTWYPAALANSLAGTDLNGSVPEIEAYFNKTFPAWYFGTDGLTPSYRWDFVSAVLHEIGHGLGFFGSMEVSGGQGSWGLFGYPFVYDLFTENGFGQSLIHDFPNNSRALADQLESGNIFFDGPNARAANGGSRSELYAPDPWNPGSSYSHLGQVFDGTRNALLTYSIDNGESIHDPGPVTRGVFQDMGWTLATQQTHPDLSLTKTVQGGPIFEPGDWVTFVLSVRNVGTGTATQVVLTDNLPSDIWQSGWTASPSLASAVARSGTTYAWDLPNMPANASGFITISGRINSSLPQGFAIVNTATISTQEQETEERNNTSTAIVGGERIYIPLAFKGSP